MVIEIVNQPLQDNVNDEFVIAIIPILLGDGVRLFDNNRSELFLKLIWSKQFEKGLVQPH